MTSRSMLGGKSSTMRNKRSASSRSFAENNPLEPLVSFLKTWGSGLHKWLEPEMEVSLLGNDEKVFNREHHLSSKYQQGKYEIQIDIRVKEIL